MGVHMSTFPDAVPGIPKGGGRSGGRSPPAIPRGKVNPSPSLCLLLGVHSIWPSKIAHLAEVTSL